MVSCFVVNTKRGRGREGEGGGREGEGGKEEEERERQEGRGERKDGGGIYITSRPRTQGLSQTICFVKCHGSLLKPWKHHNTSIGIV